MLGVGLVANQAVPLDLLPERAARVEVALGKRARCEIHDSLIRLEGPPAAGTAQTLAYAEERRGVAHGTGEQGLEEIAPGHGGGHGSATRVAAVRQYGQSAYRGLIHRAEAGGWRFGSLDQVADDGRTIYLRHDVDYSLELAVELAELNNELGVHGTFFIQLRAQFYNPFEHTETTRLLKLRALGQEIALHYVVDPGSPPTPEAVRRDFDLLATLVPDATPAFSWHQPAPDLLGAEDFDGSGLVDAYGRRFFREMAYLSDSTHRVSVDDLEVELENVEGPALQLLLHPVNWTAGGSSGLEILVRGWTRVLRTRSARCSPIVRTWNVSPMACRLGSSIPWSAYFA